MYESFFGLRERPFELAPNPKFLLLTGRHAEALGNLDYGINGRKGMTLLLGDAGTGKTTVIRTALQKWQSAGHLVVYVNNPTLTRDEFVECLAREYRLGPEAAVNKTRFLAALTDLVMKRHAAGKITGLLIDEAQSLSDELLEEIRLLANIETAAEKVFPVVLAGQPELGDRLNTSGLRQLKQRIALRCVLSPLDVRESAAYIAGRIRLAGGLGGQLFTREAVMAVHEHAGGIPRVINVICDNVLLSAFAANRRPVTREMVEEVGRDFDLKQAATAGPAGTESTLDVPAPPTAVVQVPAPEEGLLDVERRASPAAGRSPQEAEERPAESLFANIGSKRRFSFFR